MAPIMEAISDEIANKNPFICNQHGIRRLAYPWVPRFPWHAAVQIALLSPIPANQMTFSPHSNSWVHPLWLSHRLYLPVTGGLHPDHLVSLFCWVVYNQLFFLEFFLVQRCLAPLVSIFSFDQEPFGSQLLFGPYFVVCYLFSQPIIIGKALVKSIHCRYRYIKIIKLPFIFG